MNVESLTQAVIDRARAESRTVGEIAATLAEHHRRVADLATLPEVPYWYRGIAGSTL